MAAIAWPLISLVIYVIYARLDQYPRLDFVDVDFGADGGLPYCAGTWT
jgi:hypothetical protein